MNVFLSTLCYKHPGLIKLSQSCHRFVTAGDFLSCQLEIMMNTKTNNSHKLIVYPLRSLT
jgi:hypothetical protein